MTARWLSRVLSLLGAIVLTALPASAQLGPAPGVSLGLPKNLTRPADPIDRARSLSTQPRPTLGPLPEPAERWVPERRVVVPSTAREIVVPGHYERRLSDTQVEVPMLPVYGTAPQGPFHIYRHQAPPAEIRQGP
jgi:hypothetical protein